MRNLWFHLPQNLQRRVSLGACLLIVVSNLLGFMFLFPSGLTHAATLSTHTADCGVPPAAPSSQSLLVVLLDRSGSLIVGNPPTDPNGYSTSVTKALADLWIGKMAVIPFSGDTTTLPILGPSTLADRITLKNQIQETAAHIGGDTPLAPAMQEALDLLQQNGDQPGSRVAVITDGNPTGIGNSTGPDQEKQIRSQFIQQFCQRGIPVSAFGLEIDTTSLDGQDANQLLTDITNGTNATYTNVTSPEQLSQVVISLYAQWQGLSFTQEPPPQGGNFYVSIDNLAQQATIVTFRTSSSYVITLTDPNGRQIASPLATDTHYEIDSLNTGGPLLGGNYTVNVSVDPNAQVFALVKSSVHLQTLSPTSSTKVYDNQPVQIQAEYQSGTVPLTPKPGDGQIIAYVTLRVEGKQASNNGSNIVNLVQQDGEPVFSGKTIIFNQPGQLQIELKGNYQGGKLQSSFSVFLLEPPAPPCDFNCRFNQFVQNTPLLIGSGLGLLLISLALLVLPFLIRRSRRPKLEGYITNGSGKASGEVDLSDFKATKVTNIDLETRAAFDFGDARFELRQQPVGDVVLIKTLKENTSRVSIDSDKPSKRIDVTNAGVEFRPSRKIYIDGKQKASASYETRAGIRWQN